MVGHAAPQSAPLGQLETEKIPVPEGDGAVHRAHDGLFDFAVPDILEGEAHTHILGHRLPEVPDFGIRGGQILPFLAFGNQQIPPGNADIHVKIGGFFLIHL